MVFLTLSEESALSISLTNGITTYTDYSTPRRKHSSTQYQVLGTGRYLYKIDLLGDKNSSISGSLTLKAGQVYLLTLQEINATILLDLYNIPPVKSLSMLWLLPQYILISVAEVVFVFAGVEFTTTQAPRSMKTVSLALWYFSVAVGNLLIIIITYWQIFVSQAQEFFFFAGLSFIGLVLFIHLARKTKFVSVETSSSDSVCLYGNEEDSPHMAASDFSMM